MMNDETSFDQLPIMVNANTLARTLSISRQGAYKLMNDPDFPTVRIGRRLLVPKDQLIKWISEKSANSA